MISVSMMNTWLQVIHLSLSCVLLYWDTVHYKLGEFPDQMGENCLGTVTRGHASQWFNHHHWLGSSGKAHHYINVLGVCFQYNLVYSIYRIEMTGETISICTSHMHFLVKIMGFIISSAWIILQWNWDSVELIYLSTKWTRLVLSLQS